MVHCLSSYLVGGKAVHLHTSQIQYHIAAHPAALEGLADTSLSISISCENSAFLLQIYQINIRKSNVTKIHVLYRVGHEKVGRVRSIA